MGINDENKNYYSKNSQGDIFIIKNINKNWKKKTRSN